MYRWKKRRRRRLVGNPVWVMRIQRPCTCFWWGFLHVRPHQRAAASFIMQNSSRSSIKRSHTSNSLQCAYWAGGAVFSILCLIICILDKSYFMFFLYFSAPLSLYPPYLLSLSTDFHPFPFSLATFILSIIAHLFEKASDWGLRNPDHIVIREWDRR